MLFRSAWDSDYADANNIPEDMQPFYPGSWHDCDDMGHCWGVDRGAGTIQVEDEHGNTVFEKALEDVSGFGEDDENPEPEWHGGDEIWIDMKDPGTVVFIATSSEKGTFFEGDIPLKMPFNPGKLALKYDEIDGNEIITGVSYDGEDIDNWGGDTSGKSSDFGFYIAGSNKQDGKGYERYRNMDDIVYPMTDWFPKKIKPVREGVYNVKTAGKNSYTYQARWTGTDWFNTWSSDNDVPLKIKEWQGIAVDPDAEPTAQQLAHFSPDVLKQALDELAKEHGTPTADEIEALEQVECVQCDWKGLVDETYDVEGQMVCPECREPVEFVNGEDMDIEDALEELKMEFEQLMAAEETPTPNTGWPFGPGSEETAVTKETKSKWWTVKTYYKKSCEQREFFVQREGEGRITVTDGFRWCEYNVETNDGEFPRFEFREVPGGDGKRDSLDMNSLSGDNIESCDLVEMFDGGCWGGWEITGLSEEEEEKVNEFLEENSSWDLEDEGEWYLDETEVWIWGPILVIDEDGNERIIIADAEGNVTDFKE